MSYYKYKNKILFVENKSILSLSKRIKTPFYLYSGSQLTNNYLNFTKIFKKINPLICFSVKSNSNPFILKSLKNLGSGADVASRMLVTNSSGNIDAASGIYHDNGKLGIGVSSLSSHALDISGNVNIRGSLQFTGTTEITQLDTELKITDQLSISNEGTGPALIAHQSGSNDIVRFDQNNVFGVAYRGSCRIKNAINCKQRSPADLEHMVIALNMAWSLINRSPIIKGRKNRLVWVMSLRVETAPGARRR